MAIHELVYNSQVDNSGTAAPGRGLTPAVWRNVDLSVKDPSYGIVYVNDFLDVPNQAASGASAQMIVTQATNGTATMSVAEANGVLVLNCGAATVNVGPNVQFTTPGIIAKPGQLVVFEARVKVGTVTNAPKILIGLAEVNTALMGTTAIGTVNDMAAFYAVDSLSLGLGLRDTSSSTSLATGVKTLVADTYTKLAYRVVVGKSVETYVDGVLVNTSADSAKFPNGIVFPSFVLEANNSTASQSTMSIDWFGVAHLS
jgi:hypothetical protein